MSSYTRPARCDITYVISPGCCSSHFPDSAKISAALELLYWMCINILNSYLALPKILLFVEQKRYTQQ